MKRYLEIKITGSGKVGDILRTEAGLTKRQISQAKFRREGICKNGKQCRVTECAAPGDVIRVCLETDEIDSKQLMSPDENNFIERRKKQLSDIEGQELECRSKIQKLQILYEDQDILAVNKPAGMVTHPSGSHYLDSLSNQIVAYFREKNEATRIRSIGRLDKETSGILLFARNQVAAARLQKQREKGTLQKTYLAFVEGHLTENKSSANGEEHHAKSLLEVHHGSQTDLERNDFSSWKKIAIPLAPDPENPMKMTASPDGILPGSKNAVTYYKRVKSFDNATFVELHLETGRTHQIRVHMAGIGHPLLGDTLYNPKMSTCKEKNRIEDGKGRINNGNDCFKRAALHAWKLTFYHPFTDEKITLEAPFPDDFCHFLNENEEEKT